MKKQRGNGWKCAAMGLAILAAAAMAACGSGAEGSEESASAVAAVEEAATEVEETEVAEPEGTSEPEDAEAEGAETVEEPEPVLDENDPNVIDGIDFTRYNYKAESIFYPASMMNYDSLRIIVARSGKALAILKDGDTYDEGKEAEYIYYIYVPKTSSKIDTNLSMTVNSTYSLLAGNEEEERIAQSKLPYLFHLDDTTAEDGLTFTITYEDNTEESITVYITKEQDVE